MCQPSFDHPQPDTPCVCAGLILKCGNSAVFGFMLLPFGEGMPSKFLVILKLLCLHILRTNEGNNSCVAATWCQTLILLTSCEAWPVEDFHQTIHCDPIMRLSSISCEGVLSMIAGFHFQVPIMFWVCRLLDVSLAHHTLDPREGGSSKLG